MKNIKPKYRIWTIGCQMNKAESERLSGLCEQTGYEMTDSAEEADLVILNSCVVRQHAENKVIHKLNNLKSLKRRNPGMKLALTGCLVNGNGESLREKYPHVDYFFKAGERPQWLKADNTIPLPARPEISTCVPIIQGCNNFCAYCIVPYRRGRERSRPVAEIVCEVARLVEHGVKEVVLLGQNVDSYGQDLSDKPDLAGLLAEVNAIDGLCRIRFLTNHPKDMNQRLIEAIARQEKVCKQVSLPMQAGDDAILRLMQRGYTVAQYRELVTRMREKITGLALSTDVIVGFPTETEEQFGHTYDLLAELRFDAVHVAAYSPRTGTIAAREMVDDVTVEAKASRLKMVEDLEQQISYNINNGLVGQITEVLVEGCKGGKWWGRTRTDKLVYFTSVDNCLGQVVNVKIEKAGAWSLNGTKL